MIERITEFFRYLIFTAAPIVIAMLMVFTVLALFSMAVCNT